MRKKLVVFDVDSTLIDNEVIELIADYAGTREQVAEVTERAMRGELDFAESLRARVSTLRGVDVSVFARVLDDVTITRGVPETISAIHNAGGFVAAVSGGFHEILDPLALRLGLDQWRANRLETEDGRLTGRVVGPIIDAQAKADALAEWALHYGVSKSDTVAVGDGANDLLMMRQAGLSVGFCAKTIVNAEANLVIGERDMSLIVPRVINAV
jgi:phosphoserine phosphatase